MADKPVLWHLQISHYNEKVRWALDYKKIPHVRHAMLPGVHRLKARQVAGVVTSPVMEIDGQGIGESSAILEAIEERWPEPRLIPTDTAERERALGLEKWLDDEV